MESLRLINYGLKKFDTIKVAKIDEPIGKFNVWMGKKKKVEAVSAEDIYITVPKRKKRIIEAVLEYNGPLEAPISKGDTIGFLKVYLSDELIKTVEILSNEDIKKANIFSRIFNSFNYLVWGDV